MQRLPLVLYPDRHPHVAVALSLHSCSQSAPTHRLPAQFTAVCYRLYVKSPDTTQKVIVSQNAHPLACFFLSRVSMQCMQSAILLWQIRPSVCPSNGGTVCKRSEWADRHTFLMTWQGHPSSF